MVAVQEAWDLIIQHVSPLNSEKKSPVEALGYALSEPVIAPLSIPPFRQSAMDGFAVRFQDFDQFESFELAGEIQAGTTSQTILLPGQTMRIFTGAPVPEEAGMVIMQENALTNGNRVSFSNVIPRVDLNIRNIGEQIAKQDIALPKHHVVNERSVGLLASMGITEIEVYKKPKIGLLITGDELQKPGKGLKFGQIYESNGDMLLSTLRQFGFDIEVRKSVPDDLALTADILNDVMNRVDVVLTSGGISVGKYDFIKEASERNGFSEIFYKVRQKPGKPLFFAKNPDTHLFALPGNPASLLVCFYFYVLPALRLLAGRQEAFLIEKKAELGHDYVKKGGRSMFLKAFNDHTKVSLQQTQSSFDMLAFAHSNCMVYLPEVEKTYRKGEMLTIFELPD